MSKPPAIAKLENDFGLELTDIRTHGKLMDVVRHLATLDAYTRDGSDAPAAADLRAVALERLRMAPARGMYLTDADDPQKVIGLNVSGKDLREFPFDWPEWQHLEALNLGENTLTEVELPGTLSALRWLDLGENASLRRLSFAAPLPALEKLEAWKCPPILPHRRSAVYTGLDERKKRTPAPRKR